MLNYAEIALDKNHWHNIDRKPPLCPNEFEINIYKNLIGDLNLKVCLLGMTKELIEFSDFAIDLNPIESNITCIKENWLNINKIENFNADIIIGDGVLNLVNLDFINIINKKCKKFITRVFLKKENWMKYAQYFPNKFENVSVLVPTQPNIIIACWDF